MIPPKLHFFIAPFDTGKRRRARKTALLRCILVVYSSSLASLASPLREGAFGETENLPFKDETLQNTNASLLEGGGIAQR
jgi:hypothetical protein